jgi:ectoine hydroxylase-related dioxygenase (phytanoyl-CoA dioxygenase family)
MEELSTTAREDFERDGFVRAVGLIDARTVEILRAEIQRITQTIDGDPGLSYEFASDETQRPIRKIRNVSRFSSTILTFCMQSQVAELAKHILAGDIAFYGDQVLFKPAKCGSAKPLHQDAAYFRVKPPESIVTCWCALDAADESNGCMHYVPGSHRSGIRSHATLAGTPHLVADERDVRLRPVRANTGDCIIHSSLTLHMTPPNTSDCARWALLVHYVKLDAVLPQRSLHAVPVRRLT